MQFSEREREEERRHFQGRFYLVSSREISKLSRFPPSGESNRVQSSPVHFLERFCWQRLTNNIVEVEFITLPNDYITIPKSQKDVRVPWINMDQLWRWQKEKSLDRPFLSHPKCPLAPPSLLIPSHTTIGSRVSNSQVLQCYSHIRVAETPKVHFLFPWVQTARQRDGLSVLFEHSRQIESTID